MKRFNHKFSFHEMTSSTNGKTSGTATMGIIVIAVGTLCFFLGCLDRMWFTKTIDVISQAVIFTGLGISLLGYNKSQQKHLEKQEDSMPIKNDEPLV